MNSKVVEFLDCLRDDYNGKAKELLPEAKFEIQSVKAQLGDKSTDGQREAITYVERIIENVVTNNLKSARAAASSTTAKYDQHIVVTISKQNQQSYAQPGTQRAPRVENQQKDHRSMRGTNAAPTSDGNDLSKQINNNQIYHGRSSHPENSTRNAQINHGPDTQQVDMRKYENDMQRSKRAGDALRLNNPDIADLSDVNRPTKIAERFSELYDNEWTEVFEILLKKGVKERVIIDLLLQVVQEAYNFCGDEARVLRTDFKKSCKDESQMQEYMKSISVTEVSRLQKQFYNTLVYLCKGKWDKDPTRAGRTAQFANRAVELTWLMHMQSPAVYMYPTTKETFNPNIYRAYTISGQVPDYFVWPALMLYKEGGLLIKGVVQYKQ